MQNNSPPIQVIYSKRKSVSIQVHPNCTIKVRVPSTLCQNKINKIIELKQNWITKKIAFFKQNQTQNFKTKEYKEGENFYYLGKKYTLKILPAKKNLVELKESLILIYKNSKSNIKNILSKWFLKMGLEIFDNRLKVNFEIFCKHYQFPLPTLKLRRMKARWGSMSYNGIMTLNSHLIHTSLECIDYVIMHELCHLKWKNHGKKFYALQQKFVPNYKEVKKNLKCFYQEVASL